MKTLTLNSKFIVGLALALGAELVVPIVIAGPGPDHWRDLGKTKGGPTTQSDVKAAPACMDARLVSVYETKPTLSNGRGPTRTIEVGKKLECTSCDTPMIVMRPSGHNGRGAMAPVAIKGTHDCTANGCSPNSPAGK
jgi:hypothetical protein